MHLCFRFTSAVGTNVFFLCVHVDFMLLQTTCAHLIFSSVTPALRWSQTHSTLLCASSVLFIWTHSSSERVLERRGMSHILRLSLWAVRWSEGTGALFVIFHIPGRLPRRPVQRARGRSSIPGSGRLPEGDMAAHSRISAWLQQSMGQLKWLSTAQQQERSRKIPWS